MGRGIKLIADVKTYREDLLVKKDIDAYGQLDPTQITSSTDILLKKLNEIDVNAQEDDKKEEKEDKQAENKDNLP